jgi:hypothetical protein
MASTGQVVWEPLNHGPWPVRAHAAPSPLSWYALTKVFAEEAGKVMARDYGMDMMMVRLGACPRSPEDAQQIGADPIARDVYFSPGDLAQFFKLAVCMPWQGFHCLNAASRPLDQERLSLGEAKRFVRLQARGSVARCLGSLLVLEAVGAGGRHRSMSRLACDYGNGLAALTLPNLA